jgi:hypothetical protein
VDDVKVWDTKDVVDDYSFYMVNGVEIDQYDNEGLEAELQKHFDCYVEQFGCSMSGITNWSFYVNEPASYEESEDFGTALVYNDSIDLADIEALKPNAMKLMKDLNDAGIKVGKPRVFLASSVG